MVGFLLVLLEGLVIIELLDELFLKSLGLRFDALVIFFGDLLQVLQEFILDLVHDVVNLSRGAPRLVLVVLVVLVAVLLLLVLVLWIVNKSSILVLKDVSRSLLHTRGQVERIVQRSCIERRVHYAIP